MHARGTLRTTYRWLGHSGIPHAMYDAVGRGGCGGAVRSVALEVGWRVIFDRVRTFAETKEDPAGSVNYLREASGRVQIPRRKLASKQ